MHSDKSLLIIRFFSFLVGRFPDVKNPMAFLQSKSAVCREPQTFLFPKGMFQISPMSEFKIGCCMTDCTPGFVSAHMMLEIEAAELFIAEIDIISACTGISCKNFDTLQSFHEHVVWSRLSVSGTIWSPRFAELWTNEMFRLLTQANRD